MDSRRGAVVGALAVPPVYTAVSIATGGCSPPGCRLAPPGAVALYAVALLDLGAIGGAAVAAGFRAAPAAAALTYAVLGPVGQGLGSVRADPAGPVTVLAALLVVGAAETAVRSPRRAGRSLADAGGGGLAAGTLYAAVAAALQTLSRGPPEDPVGWLPFLVASGAVGAFAVAAYRRSGLVAPGGVLIAWIGWAVVQVPSAMRGLPHGPVPVVDALALDPFPDTLFRVAVVLALVVFAGGTEWFIRAAIRTAGRSPRTPSAE